MAMRVPGINWDEHWDRRVEAARRHPGRTVGYRRETDPLFDLDLREVWEQLTGEPVRGTIARCPHPDHEDCWPSCAVRARLWFCNGCSASGSIIDLGALVYDLEPRGAGFHRIREQLLAALGIVEEAA